MNKLARYYRELIASVTARLNNGERDLDSLVLSARKTLQESSELTQKEIEQVIQAVQRDLEEFARSYNESQDEFTDSVFMRVIKESLWQELADITDKTQLEWREIFKDVNHHGVYHSGRAGFHFV
ncbi:zinc ribbon-containing protein, partial [Pectobacterium aquaticum]